MNNILITSAGRRVSLVNFFKKELKQIFSEAKVFTTDLNPKYSSACHVSDKYFKVLPISDKNYVNQLLKIAIDNHIKLIIPTIDTELLVLAQNRELFDSKGIHVLVSDTEIIQSFRDKRKTHSFFDSYQIRRAKEYPKADYSLPLYIKPIDGSRSVDNYIVKTKEDLKNYHFENEKLMFLEYLDHNIHTEFTVDMYYNRNSELKCFVPRQRIEVRSGEVSKAITKDEFFVKEIKEKLSKIEGFYGCLNLQLFVNFEEKTYFGIEINPRFGGGYPLSYHANANFPKWIIQEYLKEETLENWFEDWEKDLLMLRYDDEVILHNS